MDILDIMLAKAMTPQGKTDAYVSKANKAAQKAAAAEASAAAAVATVEAAAQDIADAQAAATQLLQDAQAALQNAQAAQGDPVALPTAYSATGQNTDGYMTQKAVTDALATKADSSALAAKADASALTNLASKQYVDDSIAAIPAGSGSGGSTTNLGSANAGKMVKIGSNGNLAASSISESNIVDLLLRSDAYSVEGVLGLEIDYENKSYMRLFDAATLNKGSDFDTYSMYGGRKLCNVADDGTINVFYGEAEYVEDGSNGQVMIYQPKFYYQRLPMKVENTNNGIVMRRERLFISDNAQSGFKLHPLFIDTNGNELDYVLIPAYEGSVANNKLQSIAGVQPAAYFNPISGETAASARGTGWHMTTAQFESASQMLQMIEYGTMNAQAANEKGICMLNDDGVNNLSCTTGSTAALGNGSGAAISSTNPSGTYSNDGYRAVRYRGMENPWGNIWHTLANVVIYGDGYSRGGKPHICSTYNYNTTAEGYDRVNFNLAPSNGWISAMGYDANFDWLYMPVECELSANSAAPVGDNLWVVSNLSGIKMAAVGGNWRHEESDGIFFYACDQNIDGQLRSFGASLMYVPTKNNIYEANIAKWRDAV